MSVWITDSNSTIAEVLACGSPASEVLIKYRTDCVGCPMAAFCTIQEAIDLYDLADTQFRAEIEACLSHPISLAGAN